MLTLDWNIEHLEKKLRVLSFMRKKKLWLPKSTVQHSKFQPKRLIFAKKWVRNKVSEQRVTLLHSSEAFFYLSFFYLLNEENQEDACVSSLWSSASVTIQIFAADPWKLPSCSRLLSQCSALLWHLVNGSKVSCEFSSDPPRSLWQWMSLKFVSMNKKKRKCQRVQINVMAKVTQWAFTTEKDK